jgi:outer membrane protein OmpA-like peptidoglycan-associated protein/tetratricopeptide (TPR) repeat protein
MKKIFFLIAIVFCGAGLRAQFVYDYLKAADNYYKKADYFSAAQYYEKYLAQADTKVKNKEYQPYTVRPVSSKSVKHTSTRQQAVYQLAESYRLLHYPAKAAPWYRKAVEFDKSEFPLVRFYFASTLRALEKYEEAEKAFNQFLDEYKTDDAYSETARKEILNLRFIREQLRKKDLDRYTFTRAPASIYTTGANYAPVWTNEGALLFTSTRPDSAAGKNKTYTNRVYQANYYGGSVGNISRLDLQQDGSMHQGVISLSPDGNHLFLTRWTINGMQRNSSLYISHKDSSGWSQPMLLDSVVNTPGFNAQQPFVMPGGKYLLYASDKPGGMGGFDLWYAELDPNGKPVRSENLGSTINSTGDEQAPFYHNASRTLVFSARGRIGMGGYDFFYSKGNIGRWEEPQNFGYPVNSVRDDIYFASRGGAKNILEDVMLSSDRSSDCCLQLFSLKKIRPLRKVSGLVVACNGQVPLSGAVVNIIDTINHKTISSQRTGADGKYSFTIEDYQPLKVVASSDGYIENSLQFNAPADPEAETLINPALCLVHEAPPVAAVIVIDNVYYDFDKSTLRTESYPALDKVVDMLNEHPTMTIEISAHTDNKGSDTYNQKLSEARAANVVKYLVSKGIDASRLQSKGYGASQPVAPNQHDDGSDNPEGRQKNRRTEFKVLSN